MNSSNIQLWEVYTKNDDSFSVSEVIQENEKEYVFLTYDELGRKDALIVIKKENISEMLSNTEYLRKIHSSIEFWESKDLKSIFDATTSFSDDSSFINQSLEFAVKNNHIVTVQKINSDFIEIGFVNNITSEHIILNCISMEDAKIYETVEIPIKDIWFVEFAGLQNKVLSYVSEHM